jgi:predicted lipoprotein with Yx(FWY)xxD motif
MRRLVAIIGILASLVLVACGGNDSDTTTGPAPPAGSKTRAAASDPEAKGDKGRHESVRGTEIVIADSQFGPVLFGPKEQAIYLFDKESSDESRCYGACADAWPPVLTRSEPRAGEGVERKLLGTTRRDDGSMQVTYSGHPLYYYVDDPPGEVLCHGVEEFGGLWLVVDPSGEAVQ